MVERLQIKRQMYRLYDLLYLPGRDEGVGTLSRGVPFPGLVCFLHVSGSTTVKSGTLGTTTHLSPTQRVTEGLTSCEVRSTQEGGVLVILLVSRGVWVSFGRCF